MNTISLNVVKVLLYLLNLASLFWSAHSFIHNYIHPIDNCGNLVVLIGFGGLNTSFIIIGSFLHWVIQIIHSLAITFLLTITFTTYIQNSRECLESNLTSVWYNFNYNTTTNIIVLLYYIVLGIYSLNNSNKIKYSSLDNIDSKLENRVKNQKKNDNLYEDDEVFINSEINIAIQKENNDNITRNQYNLVLGSDEEIDENKKKQKLRFCNL